MPVCNEAQYFYPLGIGYLRGMILLNRTFYPNYASIINDSEPRP